MKKLLLICSFCCALLPARAEQFDFRYKVNADIVSCYAWRGLYLGGLSFQPDLGLGWESEHTYFEFGTWWNVGASDWGFRSGLPITENHNPNTQLMHELDVYARLNLWGVTMGFTHYYYFDGESFFCPGDINDITGSAQTEIFLGYDFSILLPNVDLTLMWYTMVSGADVQINGKRAYSSYIEASYIHHFDYDISLKGVIGVSPWKSLYTDVGEENARDFAFNNLTLRVDKGWTFAKDMLELRVFVQGTVNTCNINADNAIILASGDDKLEKQKLMGVLGVMLSFSGTK